MSNIKTTFFLDCNKYFRFSEQCLLTFAILRNSKARAHIVPTDLLPLYGLLYNCQL